MTGRNGRTMFEHQRGTSARRVMLAGLVIVGVIACAGVLSMWQYQTAHDKGSVVVTTGDGAELTGQLTSIIWQERLTAEHYLLSPSPGGAQHMASLHGTFGQLSARLAATVTPAEGTYQDRALQCGAALLRGVPERARAGEPARRPTPAWSQRSRRRDCSTQRGPPSRRRSARSTPSRRNAASRR